LNLLVVHSTEAGPVLGHLLLVRVPQLLQARLQLIIEALLHGSINLLDFYLILLLGLQLVLKNNPLQCFVLKARHDKDHV
jgi:hypothetical protein